MWRAVAYATECFLLPATAGIATVMVMNIMAAITLFIFFIIFHFFKMVQLLFCHQTPMF